RQPPFPGIVPCGGQTGLTFWKPSWGWERGSRGLFRRGRGNRLAIRSRVVLRRDGRLSVGERRRCEAAGLTLVHLVGPRRQPRVVGGDDDRLALAGWLL